MSQPEEAEVAEGHPGEIPDLQTRFQVPPLRQSFLPPIKSSPCWNCSNTNFPVLTGCTGHLITTRERVRPHRIPPDSGLEIEPVI